MDTGRESGAWLANRVNGGRAAAEALKAALITWKNLFTVTANFISNLAAGNAAIIISAGFIPTKSQTQSLPKPGAVNAFRATINGSKGAILATAKNAVPLAKAYVFAALPPEATASYVNDTMVITIGESSIYINANTRGAAELYNLQSGVPYSVSMYAFNSAGSGPASASQQVIPQ